MAPVVAMMPANHSEVGTDGPSNCTRHSEAVVWSRAVSAAVLVILLSVFCVVLSANAAGPDIQLWQVPLFHQISLWRHNHRNPGHPNSTSVAQQSTSTGIASPSSSILSHGWLTGLIGIALAVPVIIIFCYKSPYASKLHSRWGAPAVASDTTGSTKVMNGTTSGKGGASSGDPLLQVKGPTGVVAKKFVPLAVMCFAALFTYTLLSNTKDALIVTAPQAGAEALPFLKTYVNLPGAVLWTLVLTKLSNRMAQVNVFYCVVTTYLTFFLVFLFIMYPARNLIHPEVLADHLEGLLPTTFRAPIALFRYWTFSIFYVMAETWGSVVFSTILWGLVNQVCSVEEAKRYYPFLGFIGNLGCIAGGQYGQMVSAIRASSTVTADWDITLYWLTSGVVASGIIMLLGCRYIQTCVLTDLFCVDPTQQRDFGQKTKLSVGESTQLLINSSYLRSLALLVVCYGLSMNIVDVSWKSKLRTKYPNPNDYSAFMGRFSSFTGVVTLSLMLLSSHLLRHCGWGVSAATTPIAIGITGISFFILALGENGQSFMPLAAWLNTDILTLAVLVGAIQSSFSKSAKWALFDPCKNMAYIPLDPEARTKGKAAIDVVGGPLGKSGGAFLQQVLIISLGTLNAATPCLLSVLIIVIIGWLYAVVTVSRQFDAASKPGA